jgi:hypothetical protein
MRISYLRDIHCCSRRHISACELLRALSPVSKQSCIGLLGGEEARFVAVKPAAEAWLPSAADPAAHAAVSIRRKWRIVVPRRENIVKRRDTVSKGMDRKKEAKKKPAKSAQEKRAAKKEKKQNRGFQI